jgi:hypothetical protein
MYKGINEIILGGIVDYLSLMILVYVLYSVGGGFGTIFNYLITPEIRALNRSSIFIVCLSLCVCAFFGDYLVVRLKTHKKRIIFYTIISLIGALVIYSEVLVTPKGWQIGAKEKDEILTEFFTNVDAIVSDGEMVYELPFIPFPENPPVVEMPDYELAMGYIYTNNIRWSYGGLRGRNTEAQELYLDEGRSKRFIKKIQDQGFVGVYLDTKGYEDNGEAVIDFYTSELGLTPIISADGWLYYYDIRGVKIDIDERTLVDGYDFVEEYTGYLGLALDTATLYQVAVGIEGQDEDTYELLWEWTQDSEEYRIIENEMDYVLFLYHNILGRDEANPQVWAEQIESGSITREDAFIVFLESEEFREHNEL